jgi:molecular chaperone DnaJ
VTCAECQGSGQKQQTRTKEAMHFVTITSCPRCAGRGVLIESLCQNCRGSGLEFVAHQIRVQVPAGVDNGMMLRLAGQGEDASPPAEAGDLLVRVMVRPHPSLARESDDLYTTAAIDFVSAALGTRLRLRGKGMPRLSSRGKGDLYVIVRVTTPTHLTPCQRELLRQFREEEVRQSATAS